MAPHANTPTEQILTLLSAELGADACAFFAIAAGIAVVRGVAGDTTTFGLARGTTRRIDRSPTLEALLATDKRPLNIGAYLAVPVRTDAGRTIGTVCALRTEARPTWDEHDERIAAVLARVIAHEERAHTDSTRTREAIRAALAANILEMVFQPVFELAEGALVAYEALARFSGEPSAAPADWFAAAEESGIGTELELAAVRAALALLDHIPLGVRISLNISPAAAISPEFATCVEPVASRVIIEVTERASVDDYAPLVAVLARLRARGAKLAVDDVGAGYASLQHILNLEPDIVKLDLSLTRDIVSHAPRRALAAALVGFGDGTGATIAAEGIESEGELVLLRELGVGHGQGFHLGYPQPLAGCVQ